MSIRTKKDEWAKTLCAFYDFAACPPTFDFINFICMVESACKVGGYNDFKVVFLPGPVDGFRSKTSYSPSHLRYRVQNIILPSLALAPHCCGFHYLTDREEGRAIAESAGEQVFPWGYNIDKPVGYYNWGASVEMLREGHNLLNLSASSAARQRAKQWLQTHCGDKKPIVITLRESPYEPARNSNLTAWRDFVRTLPNDYCAIFIRDHDQSLEALPDQLEGILLNREAPWNLEFRTALYELAYIAFFVNNGPWLLGILNPNVNCAIMNLIVEAHSVSSSDWFRRMGMLPSQLNPFWGPTQALFWEPDDLENIEAAFDTLQNKVEGLFDPYFDSEWYLSQYPETSDEISQMNFANPLEHYKHFAGERALSPNAYFDEHTFRTHSPTVSDKIRHGVIRNGFEEFLKSSKTESLLIQR